MRRRALPLVALAVLAGTLAACEPPVTEAEAASQVAPVATPVEVAVLNTAPYTHREVLIGETGAIRTANVTPEAGGRLTRFELEEGQRVEEGDRVASVDTSLNRSQRNQLQIQRDQLDNEIERTTRLIARGLANDPELERLQSQRDAIDAQISGVRIVERQARVEAPITGTVVDTYVEAGEVVAPGTPLARILDMSTVVVRVGLPERDLSFVREGTPVTVHLEALNETLEAEVGWIGLEANGANRTFPLDVYLDNTEGHLRAGMRATVSIIEHQYTDAVMVPRDAILQGVSGDEVIVVTDGAAHVRPISVGPGDARYVVVTEGLNAGDQLIVRGQNIVVPGETVDVVGESACCAEQVAR